MRECHRLLVPGGVLRVAMPALQALLDNYASGEWRNDQHFHMPEVKTRAEYLNINFRSRGHQWIYDYEELERRLREVGFIDIVETSFQQSDHPILQGIERREEALLICEATRSD